MQKASVGSMDDAMSGIAPFASDEVRRAPRGGPAPLAVTARNNERHPERAAHSTHRIRVYRIP